MAGWNRPATGYCGTWASQEQLQNAVGVAFDEWKPFGGGEKRTFAPFPTRSSQVCRCRRAARPRPWLSDR